MLALLLINGLAVAAAVMIHYEFLRKASRAVPRMRCRRGLRIVFGVYLALIAHTVEIWFFGLIYWLVHWSGDWGHLAGNFSGSLLDCVYFSFTTFTTLGFGDIEPHGQLRFLVGMESLTGLVLITWSASFLFYEMQRHWEQNP
ncbi:MAG: two pore domain potassium channel family protein [Gammaproteobacteria bacterium]|nr:two pore domain potassium channel family protein [Gammaproteobacteria bacterium]